jgi:hypothetical protein
MPEMAVDPEAVKQEVLAVVYKNRIKVKNFFLDFDRHLRGIVSDTQFKAVLHGMAGIKLRPAQLDALADLYKEADGRVNYRDFVTDCDLVFTKPYLEKTPLEDVPLKPDELLAPTRFVTIPGTAMDPSSELAVQEALEELKTRVKLRRIFVRPIFEDAGCHAPKSVMHMTASRFCRGIKAFAPATTQEQVDLLVAKFTDDGNLVNFGAFLAIVDPSEVFEGTGWQ